MKAIMYHYVRPENDSLPFFKHLHIDDFKLQLDFFEKEFGFISKEQFEYSILNGEPANGVVLTFDDGILDHYQYVFPELLKRNLWGIFYVPTAPYLHSKMLDVHRIHLLIGTFGGLTVAKELKKLTNEHMLSDLHRREFKEQTYDKQDNDNATQFVKRTLNYFISYEWRSKVLDELFYIFWNDTNYFPKDFYMSKKMIKEMHDNNMIIGSHSITHRVFSKLTDYEQKKEITDSFSFLQEIINNPIKTFCYPYGGFHTFTDFTEELLSQVGCNYSFNVESRDITNDDIMNRPQALPRFDCNEFPFGKVRS